MTFASATAVRRDDAGTFDGDVEPGWDVGGIANGGYLLAIAARACAMEAERDHPVTITAHYLNPTTAGPVTIGPTLVRRGRRFATTSAVVSRDDAPLMAVLGTFGTLGSAHDQDLVDAAPPDIPPPDDCVLTVPTSRGGFAPELMGKVDLRLDPEDAGFESGRPSGKAQVRGWFRLLDDEPTDPFGLLLAVDAFPPTAFNAALPVAWTPTLELTAHIRSFPEPGWMRCAFTTRFITGGMLEEDGEVWDSSGRLVAQSRQLALVPKP
jgi:acyl-CoA thioesterase